MDDPFSWDFNFPDPMPEFPEYSTVSHKRNDLYHPYMNSLQNRMSSKGHLSSFSSINCSDRLQNLVQDVEPYLCGSSCCQSDKFFKPKQDHMENNKPVQDITEENSLNDIPTEKLVLNALSLNVNEVLDMEEELLNCIEEIPLDLEVEAAVIEMYNQFEGKTSMIELNPHSSCCDESYQSQETMHSHFDSTGLNDPAIHIPIPDLFNLIEEYATDNSCSNPDRPTQIEEKFDYSNANLSTPSKNIIQFMDYKNQSEDISTSVQPTTNKKLIHEQHSDTASWNYNENSFDISDLMVMDQESSSANTSDSDQVLDEVEVKRRKNNEASKKSRDKKKQREQKIALELQSLEKRKAYLIQIENRLEINVQKALKYLLGVQNI